MANGSVAKEASEELRGITVGWDQENSVVIVSSYMTNFAQQFKDIRAGKAPTAMAVPNTNAAPNTTTSADSKKYTVKVDGGGAYVIPGPTGDMELREEAVRLTNDFRAENGKSYLVINNDLMAIAQARAEKMVSSGVFNHNLPDGYGNWRGTAMMLGYTYLSESTMGENMYRSKPAGGPAVAVNNWKASAGHKANLLAEKYNEIGIGYAVNNETGQGYWVQVFAGN